MSLILEALRKSEAERRRAAVPDLLAEPQAAAPVAVQKTNRIPLIVVGGLAAVVVLWFATRNPQPAPVSVIPVDADTTVAQEVQLPARAEPAPASVQAASEQAAASVTPRSTPVRRPLVVAAPVAPAPAASALATTAAATVAATQAPKPTPVVRDAPPPRIEPIAAATPPPRTVIDTTPRVDELRGSERNQLPALKLSMHMWNDDAAQRFVIIDGARLRIGDHIGSVVVADILKDGVLLDWNGRPLKLPLP
jgi:general secretion pathway protein B